jgi:type II secretory pathway pseudopilin PulG
MNFRSAIRILSLVAQNLSPARLPEKAALSQRRRGFTLIQMVTTLAIVAMIGTWAVHSAGAGRQMAYQSQCNSNLKAIAMALDAHRQEVRQFPASLSTLTEKKYIANAEALHCPEDPDPAGTYEAYYLARSPRDTPDVPSVICPFHRNRNTGVQAFYNRQVEQFTTRPAVLTSASGATVQRPGEVAITAIAGMELHGADIIRTARGGSALITFADSSTASLQAETEVTLLQSFIDGKTQGTFYSLVRQLRGTVEYGVFHGSKFDVATPTAVCSALGTRFKITVTPDPNSPIIGGTPGNATMSILVTEGKVKISTRQRSGLAPFNTLYSLTSTTLDLPGLPPVTGLLPFGL